VVGGLVMDSLWCVGGLWLSNGQSVVAVYYNSIY